MIAEDIGLSAMCDELVERLEELVPAVVSTGNNAKISIVVTLKHTERGDGIDVEGVVRSQDPKRLSDSSAWTQRLYRTEDGELTTTDPRQPTLMDTVTGSGTVRLKA